MFSAGFLEFIQKSWGIYGLGFVLLVAFILYIPKFVDSLGYFKVLKIRYLNEALDSDHIDNISKKLLSESLASIYFTKCTGIRANEEERHSILATYDILKGKFNISDIYYSVKYIPRYPHLFSIPELVETKAKLEKRLKLNYRILMTMVILTMVSFLGFIYFSAEAFYNNSFFTIEYFNTGFLAGCCFIMGLINYFDSVIAARRINIAQDIVEYFLAIPDED